MCKHYHPYRSHARCCHTAPHHICYPQNPEHFKKSYQKKSKIVKLLTKFLIIKTKLSGRSTNFYFNCEQKQKKFTDLEFWIGSVQLF